MYYSLAVFKTTLVSFRSLLHHCKTTSNEAKHATELKKAV